MGGHNNLVFISWQPHCSRSDAIASELGGKSYMIYYEIFGSNYHTILFKYILQTIKSLAILIKMRPKTVFVMSPPLFACMPVYIYCKLFKRKYIIDAHTGAFVNPIWQKFMWLQKFFAKNALSNIITNNALKKFLIRWKARFDVISDVPIVAKDFELIKLKKGFNVTLINSFAKDEPIEEFIESTRKIEDINFYVTGKINSSVNKYLKIAPGNVQFTGFLDPEKYLGLILASDLIVVLTKLDNTMQRGAYEAIYNGKPVVTSNWEVLKENFGKAAVIVDNTSEDIARGIREALNNLDYLKENASKLRLEKLRRWKVNKSILSKYL